MGMDRPRKNVVSISGGKDSAVTALYCRETEDASSMVLISAETDHEHPITYDYLRYLEDYFGMPIHRLRADFTDRIARKRRYVQEVWPTEGVPQEIVDRALAVLQPTGNAMLDLCIWKGRFPSRKAQFCTEELKTTVLMNFQLDLIEQGYAVWSWQGIRADESLARRYRPAFEQMDDHLFIYRPIIRWTAADVFEAHAYCGLKPNPLYLQGMRRVGCMPCINSGKDELAEIVRRWPDVIEKLALWERIVAAASKRQAASFFPAPEDGRGELQGRNIRERVEWSRTSLGGKQFDLMADLPAPKCSSHYALCE